MLCLTVEAITNAAESTWDPVKRKATSVENRDRNAALEDIDAIEWIKTQPAEKPKAETTQDSNLENLKEFMEARNPKSHFNITNIMDDGSVASLLKLSGTSNNNTKVSKNSGSTQLEEFTPGVFIPGEDQTTQDNNSLSNLSSK